MSSKTWFLFQSNSVIDRDLNLPFKYKHLSLEYHLSKSTWVWSYIVASVYMQMLVMLFFN